MDLIATTTISHTGGGLLCVVESANGNYCTSYAFVDLSLIGFNSVISNAEFLFVGFAIIIFLLTIDVFLDFFNIKPNA